MHSNAPTDIYSKLTDEQASVVEASPTTRIIVTAGPGTGKTHVLIARLAALVEDHGLSPGHELLVLSFSRAAVREIRTRLATAGRDVRYVRAYTFDSFATRLLSEIEPDGPWSQLDYESRIRYATSIIQGNVEAKDRIQGYTHILIDEIQDLVGERVSFVQAILQMSSGGFTLLGDSAQGIYNFQAEGEARRMGSKVFYNWLQTRFRNELVEYRLTKNHRARSEVARVALWAGSALNAAEPNYEDIKDRLETVILGLPSLGKFEHALPVLKSSTLRTAILCRTNGQALVLSRKLHEAGIDHCLQRSAVDRVVPSWIGTFFAAMDQSQIGKTAFLNLVSPLLQANAIEPEAAWKLLKRIDTKVADKIDIKQLAERIRVGNVPDELTEQPAGNLIVSTIHRSKGLEFDRVIIVEPEERDDDDLDEIAEETRVLYVALTRPKRELLHMCAPGTRGIYLNKSVDRWVRRYKSWQMVAVEIQGADTHSADPAGGFLLENCHAGETQSYIRDYVKPGDPIMLTRLKVSVSGTPRIFYTIEHNGRAVGITSERFGQSLFRVLKINDGWKVNWPIRIEDIYVETIDTVAGTSAAGQRCGLGASGIWLRVRTSGLGSLVFEKLEKR